MRICGNCYYNDGCVYTSNPPKYRCTFTGDFHFGNEPCKVDLVPVVRCKDCAIAQHDELFGQWYCNGKEVKPDGYCSDGERRTDDAQ